MKKSLLVVSPAVVVACWSSDASAIIGGQPDPAPSPVVAISGTTTGGSTGLVCTGTLVAPNVVLTARHCIEDGDPVCSGTFNGAAKFASLGVTTENDAYVVASTIVPTTNNPCNDDVALLVLAAAVPATDSPTADVRLTTAIKGEPYSAVGYGRICAEDGSQCSSGGQRNRKDGLSVECLDCRKGTWRGTSESTCVGDSGGPAFDAQKRVFGVTSVGGFGCTTAYYTRLENHVDFLRDKVKAEATNAGLAAPAWTTGEIGGAGGGTTDPGADGGTGTAGDGDGGTTAAASAQDDGCVVAPRSGSSSTSDAIRALSLAGIVLLTRACRRSRRRALTTTSSARATRSTADRTIPADTTRCSTTSRSSS
jgi:secreted trypsin-like serine protease